MHRTSPRFRSCLGQLPDNIQRVAQQKFELLKSNPQHPSLHFKRVGSFWSVRVSLFYRSLAIQDGNDFIWVWIGTHSEYDRLLDSR